ncbi:DUF2207 domain-containing protein [Devosia sp.]|uniref:DUF2207 domain-containing protein n=1 Tax=Devosia sp. TaxID=1871048 RepID=UPI0032672009
MRAAIRLVIATFSMMLLLALPATASEEIRSFTSNLVLAADGSVAVTESLSVNVENIEIHHGIYRDIPVVMIDDQGNKVRPDLNVISVKRDTADEPFHTERMGNFIRIWIGDGDVWLDNGVINYEIKYTMNRMGRFFADHDEVYWNATGNYWNFPILESAATVQLPDGAVITDISGYTGAVGSKAQDVTITRKGENKALIRTNVELAPGQGMTYAVSFQKGILVEPSSLTKFWYWFEDRQDAIIPGIGALITLLYFTWAWGAVGRDPKKGVVIPLFHAPDGLSPGLAHYISNWGWKKNGWTAFTASIFDLGVKGLVTIDNTGDLTVKPTGKRPDAPLSPGEDKVFAYFNSGQGVTVNKSTGPTLEKKRAEFVAAIEAGNNGTWFRDNWGYTGVGIAIGAAMLGIMVLAGYLDIPWLIGAVVAGVIVVIISNVGKAMLGGSIFSRVMLLIWVVVAGVNFLGGAVTALSTLELSNAAIAAASIVAIILMFIHLMRAPTVEGRKKMDEIDGFKMYMDTAEKNRLNMEKEPPMTVNRFEAILPFAIALGVEKAWSGHFEKLLAANAVDGMAAGAVYAPYWYSGGRDFSTNNISSAVSAAASSMSAAMVAAQPVQSSSSGGGGGGSSGGGGGGGGGGGW